MFEFYLYPNGWSTLKRLIWLFVTTVGQTERDPTSPIVNIARVDYATLTE